MPSDGVDRREKRRVVSDRIPVRVVRPSITVRAMIRKGELGNGAWA